MHSFGFSSERSTGLGYSSYIEIFAVSPQMSTGLSKRLSEYLFRHHLTWIDSPSSHH